MKRFLATLTVFFGLLNFCCQSYAQPVPEKDLNKEPEKLLTKEDAKKQFPRFNPEKPLHFAGKAKKAFMIPPRGIMGARDFFMLADELNLTDDQIVKLRAYYKKHFSKDADKLSRPMLPKPEDFCKMTEEEMNKFADDAAKNVHDAIMAKLQKIIDLKKILSPEQLEKLRKIGIEEKKKREDSKKKHNADKKKHEDKMMGKKPSEKPGRECVVFQNPMRFHRFPMGDKNHDKKCCPMMHNEKNGHMPKNHKMDRHDMMPPVCPMMNHHGMKPHENPMFGCCHAMPPMCPMMRHQSMMPQKNSMWQKGDWNRNRKEFWKKHPLVKVLFKILSCQKCDDCDNIKDERFDKHNKKSFKPDSLKKPEGREEHLPKD